MLQIHKHTSMETEASEQTIIHFIVGCFDFYLGCSIFLFLSHFVLAICYLLLFMFYCTLYSSSSSFAICHRWCKSRLFLKRCRKFFPLFLESVAPQLLFYFLYFFFLAPSFDQAAEVIDDEDTTPIQSFAQSENFINLLLSITCVGVGVGVSCTKPNNHLLTKACFSFSFEIIFITSSNRPGFKFIVDF